MVTIKIIAGFIATIALIAFVYSLVGELGADALRVRRYHRVANKIEDLGQ